MKIQPIDIHLLRIAMKADVKKMGLRQLGRLLNVSKPEHPQTVKYHLEKLDEAGLLGDRRKARRLIGPAKSDGGDKLFDLPILGYANCGPAEILTEENIIGYLKISPRILQRKKSDGLFVVRAVGNSLNQAFDIPGGPVEEGDYVVVDSEQKTPKSGDYILSVIDGAANLKKYFRQAKQIKLVSESTEDIPPIYIHEDEKDEYLVNGIVVRVMKNSWK